MNIASCSLDTILVEDDEAILMLLAVVLRRTGRSVAAAGTVAGALNAWERSVRLVVTDLVLPDGYGTVLGRDLYRISPATRFVFMSGWPHECWPEAAVDALQSIPPAAVRLLAKPFHPHELRDTIASLVRAPAPGLESAELEMSAVAAALRTAASQRGRPYPS